MSTIKKESFPERAEGLFRYTNVFTDEELKFMTDEIKKLYQLGKNGKLVNNKITFNESSKRIQINFGYYYSYGFDKEASILKAHSKDKSMFNRSNSKGVQPVQMEKNLYGKELAIPVEPMPSWINKLVDKLIQLEIISEENRYNSALINIYPKHGAIFPHIDDFPSFERNIATIRLVSPTIMSFGYTGADSLEKAKKQDKHFRMKLPVGSVVIMSGFAASKITHSIMQEDTSESETVSITLRKLLPNYLPNNYESYYLDS